METVRKSLKKWVTSYCLKKKNLPKNTASPLRNLKDLLKRRNHLVAPIKPQLNLALLFKFQIIGSSRLHNCHYLRNIIASSCKTPSPTILQPRSPQTLSSVSARGPSLLTFNPPPNTQLPYKGTNPLFCRTPYNSSSSRSRIFSPLIFSSSLSTTSPPTRPTNLLTINLATLA